MSSPAFAPLIDERFYVIATLTRDSGSSLRLVEDMDTHEVRLLRHLDDLQDERARSHFAWAGQLLAGFRHPACAPVVEHRDRWLLYDFSTAGSADELIDSYAPLHPPLAVRQIERLAEGLNAAYGHGLAHPSLTEFMLRQTSDGQLQIAGLWPVSGRAERDRLLSEDLYQLARTLLGMLTGDRNAQPDQVPGPLRAPLRRALLPTADDRYLDPGQFAAALADARRALPTGLAVDTSRRLPAPPAARPAAPSRSRALAAWVAGSAVGLAAVAAGAFTLADRVMPRTLPLVVGVSEPQARQQLQARDFSVVVRRQTDRAAAGQVIGQTPGPGSKLRPGSRVSLVVSSGAPKVKVPDVTGLTADDAEYLLRDAGFAVRQQQGLGRQPGRVAASRPAGGSLAPSGSDVVIVVAQEQAVTVPLVEDISLAGAQRQLRQAGLRWRVRHRRSQRTPGRVVDQEPGVGRQVPEGSVVELAVSIGTGPIKLGDFVGLQLTDARLLLTERGLRVVTVDQATTDPQEYGLVLEQRPARGTRLRRGHTVTLSVGVAG